MPVIQLDLFEERTIRLQRCRRALLESLDVERAREELRAFVDRHGTDGETDALLGAVAGVEAALAGRAPQHGDPVEALLRAGPTIPTWLRPGWHRRLAGEAERRHGAGARVGDETAGWHLLRAGDLTEAERSLRATLDLEPADARSRAHLGDVLHLRGETAAARVEYLRALVEGPDTIDWSALADAEVQALPAIAATEHQAAGSAAGWAASMGTVEGVLPWPAPTLLAVGEPPSPHPEHAGLRFYRLLCEERAARSLADRARVRRELKALCPSLLEADLGRWR